MLLRNKLERRKNIDQIHNQRHHNFTWKTQIGKKKSRSCMQIHCIIRDITREEETTSHSLCIYNDIHTHNPNDGASLFIENYDYKL